MSDAPARLADRAGELRLAFDRTFAEPARPAVIQAEDFLALRIGSEPYALRLSEIAGLYVDRAVTRLAGGKAALLGLASFRGAIAPVYDLHLLLGHPMAKAPRWLVILQASSVAFAFETFEGHLRVPRDAMTAQGAGQQAGRLVREFASTGGLIRAVVHPPSVLDAIRTPSARANIREE